MQLNVHFIGGWSYSPDQLTPFAEFSTMRHRMVTHPFNTDFRDIHLTGEPMVLIGWSLGGLRILDAISTGVIKPAAIILISSTSMFCADSEHPNGVNRKALLSMKRGISNDRNKTLEQFYRDAAQPQPTNSHSLVEILQLSSYFSTEALQGGLKMLEQLDCRSGLSAITIPTLILHGAKDAIISPDDSSYLHAHIPDSALHIHPDAGHEMLIRQAEWTVHHCTNFLNNLMP